MQSELIVDVNASEINMALTEDGRLVSFQKETRNAGHGVGDIYLARVRKVMPGLNAAFVSAGHEKDAFLHYLDLGPHFATYKAYLRQALTDKRRPPSMAKLKQLPEIDKQGAIADQLEQGEPLLVQVIKEPISSKGPRLTTEITFTGRNMVLIPFGDKISISQKIKTTEEKVRLRQLMEAIKPKNFGVIVRTSAEGKRVAELNNEMKQLVASWEATVAKAQKATPPAQVFEEESRTVGLLRDIFSPSFEAIHVNDREVYEQIRKYVSLIAPERVDIVKLYQKPEPIMDTFAVTRQVKSSFGKTVSFKSGAYLIIESTEALHVIDVNSGNRSKSNTDQESNALDVNMRAADEIARQLRLRDMGGIIVVDFIDMNKQEHRQQLYDHMRELMANDRARHNILPLSKFGLMQITRQRVRPAQVMMVEEDCPSCYGKGTVSPSLLFTDVLKEKIDYLTGQLNQTGFTLYVHPFVEAYIKKGWLKSLYKVWRLEAAPKKFKLVADQSLAYLQYRVVGADGQEIDLKEEKDVGSSATKTGNKTRTRTRTADDEEEKPQPDKQPDKQPKKAAKAEKPAKEVKEMPSPKRQAKQKPSAPEEQPDEARPAQEETPAEPAKKRSRSRGGGRSRHRGKGNAPEGQKAGEPAAD